jgi:hypothetical protein
MHLRPIIAIFAIAALSAHAQAQQLGYVPKPTKADAERVVQIITGDKTKTQKFCELANLEIQIEQADKQKDTKTVEDLSQRIVEIARNLGPEYILVLSGLERYDFTFREAKEITSILDALDKLCGQK